MFARRRRAGGSDPLRPQSPPSQSQPSQSQPSQSQPSPPVPRGDPQRPGAADVPATQAGNEPPTDPAATGRAATDPATTKPATANTTTTDTTTAAPGPGDSAADPGPTDSRRSWRHLWRAARLRPSRSGLVVALLAVLLGVALSTQIGQTRQRGLEGLRQSELVAVLDAVTQRSARLDEEIARLTAERDRLQREQGLDPDQARAAATARADALGILAGTLAARGPGVRITVSDPGHVVGSATILDAVQELRDAGAEAIQIGPTRVVASSYLTEDPSGRVAVDGRALGTPYTVLAIGDAQTMASAMAIPGGVVESIRGLGATITVQQEHEVLIDALHAPFAPRYARPQSSPTGSPTGSTSGP